MILRVSISFLSRPAAQVFLAIALYAKVEWALLDIPFSSEIDVCSGLRADIAEYRDKYVNHSVETPNMTYGVFRLVLRGINTLSEQKIYFQMLYSRTTGRPSHRHSCFSVKSRCILQS